MLPAKTIESIKRFLLKDVPVNPYLLLVQLAYIHAFGGIDYSSEVFAIAILFTAIFGTNYFWFVGIIIQPNLVTYGVVNLAFGIASCNERWKTLMFLYVFADLMFLGQPFFSEFYNVVALVGLLYENFCGLPFRNIF